MKRQYFNTSFNYNPSFLGADRLWADVKNMSCREDIIVDDLITI